MVRVAPRAAPASASARARRRAGSGRRTRTLVGSSRSDGTRPGISREPARARRRPRTVAGSRPSRPIVYGCCGCAKRSCDGRLLRLAPGVHHEHAVGDVRDDAEVVRDQDDRGAEPLADVAHQVEDLRPGSSRRAPSSARRRSAPSDRTRAPSRSSPAAASRRRAGADTRRAAARAPGCARARSSSIVRARASRRDRPRCLVSTSPIWRPTVKHRVERRHRLLEDERDLRGRARARSSRGDSASRSVAVEQRAAADHRRLGQQPHERHARDALAAARLADDPEHLARGRA